MRSCYWSRLHYGGGISSIRAKLLPLGARHKNFGKDGEKALNHSICSSRERVFHSFARHDLHSSTRSLVEITAPTQCETELGADCSTQRSPLESSGQCRRTTSISLALFTSPSIERRNPLRMCTMDFEQRLERAIARGQHHRSAMDRERAERAMTEEECKNLHSKARLELSEHIESCLRKLVDHFAGFDFQSLVGTDGWGAKITRDDLAPGEGKPLNKYYSRLEMLVRPYSASHIVELIARGTIRNKELFSRTHYQQLSQLDLDGFRDLIDQWVLEYAEKFASRA